ncbi:MAG: CHAT domain-containing protein [Chloroflexota bacterium]
MDIESLMDKLLQGQAATEALIASLNETEASTVVDRLKSEADRHWYIDANRSLALAELIIQIGRVRENDWQIALGLMARGDALKFTGHFDEAWKSLEESGQLFRSINNEVGWARTRIGRLVICVEMNQVTEALADANAAREIFTRYEEQGRLAILLHNTAIVQILLGNYYQALSLFHLALDTEKNINIQERHFSGQLYSDMGYAHALLGDFRQATRCFEHARDVFIQKNEIRGIALAEMNIADIVTAQGKHRQALQLLYYARDLYYKANLSVDAIHVNRNIVRNYLLLNRYSEACSLAEEVITTYRQIGASYREGLTLLYLATAEAELGHLEAAQKTLDLAETVFVNLQATNLVATTQLRRARIALRQKDVVTARQIATDVAEKFNVSGQKVLHAEAMLLHGQAAFLERDLFIAERSGKMALQIAQRNNLPAIRYSAHLLLGHIAEIENDDTQAMRRYTAAIATVERLQHELTITLRPGFLEDKEGALRSLLALYLRKDQTIQAFETLERTKSQALLNYIANQDQLRWSSEDPQSELLIEELNRLREEHQWFYRLAHDRSGYKDEQKSAVEPEQALTEVASRERRMRQITEQLYLQSEEKSIATGIQAPTLHDVQKQLDQDTTLIEFYSDGTHFWAFTVTSTDIDVHRLPMNITKIDQTLAQLQTNLNAALNTGTQSTASHNLTKMSQRILKQLYTFLLEPLVSHFQDQQRLAIVPYGLLHYLPFHLLYNGSQYLIEQYEIVILPAASLISQDSPRCKPGVLALSHSWQQRLPRTLTETQMVQQLFGGSVYSEEMATRDNLQTQPNQILHIAAHGKHRLDQPELSYIELADGQLWADDLLQHDLSYELVTLSACETGRAQAVAGDELIGLGRGFFYAGAGALITSLWRVEDDLAVEFMKRLYQELSKGASKAAALRMAQLAMLTQYADLHPAFWGAFQLVGNAEPLSASAEKAITT